MGFIYDEVKFIHTRNFDGQVFTLSGRFIHPHEAELSKTLLKKEGYLVRITKSKYKGKTCYDVWIRGK